MYYIENNSDFFKLPECLQSECLYLLNDLRWNEPTRIRAMTEKEFLNSLRESEITNEDMLMAYFINLKDEDRLYLKLLGIKVTLVPEEHHSAVLKLNGNWDWHRL